MCLIIGKIDDIDYSIFLTQIKFTSKGHLVPKNFSNLTTNANCNFYR